MIVPSGEIYVRNIYPQTGDFRVLFDITSVPDKSFNLSLDDTAGTSATYTFNKKRFEDYFGNFSHVYETGQNLKFEVARSGGILCEWMNDRLIKSYNYNYYFFPATFDLISFGYASYDVEVDIRLFGEKPTLTFENIETTDSYNYSGRIVNQSLATRMFGATGLGFPITFPSIISGGKTGVYTFTTDQIKSSTQTDITFDFDFGQFTQTIGVTDPNNIQPNPTGFTNFSIDKTNLYSGSESIFNISDYATVDRILGINLEHTNRIGNTYYSGTGYGTGTYSGQINGSGYLQSYNLSGYISGYLGSGYGVKYHYASGQVIAEYAVTATGYEAGNLSTGVLVGTLTGTALPNVGYYSFVGTVTGKPSVSVWHGGVNSSPVANYTGDYNFTKLATGYYSVLSSGDITLGVSSSPVSMNGVQNHFTLTTGEPGYDTEDFTSNGYYAGNEFNYNSSYESGEYYETEGVITYINGQYGVYDEALLTISGLYSTYTAQIYATVSKTEANSRIFVGYIVKEESGSPVYKSRYYYPDTDTYVDE